MGAIKINIAPEQQVTKRRPLGKSRAGDTTKIHLTVDGYGLPVEFEVTSGEVNDCSAAADLIVRLSGCQATWCESDYCGQGLT